MKRKIVAFLSIFLIVIIAYYSLIPFLHFPGSDDKEKGFVRTKGNEFVIKDNTFTFIGANIIPESFVGLSSKKEKKLAKDLVESGVNSRITVFRVVAEKEVEEKIVPVDEIVRRCEVYSCYVLIAFDEYKPGMNFEEYKETIEDYVLRFKDSKAVFGWEIFDVKDEMIATEDLEPAGELIHFVKELDPNHLVALGGNGLEVRDGSATVTQFKLVQALGDFCVIDYDSYTVDSSLVSNEEELNKWKKDVSAFFDVIKDCNNKPVLLESFGFRSNLDRDREELYEFMFFEAKSRKICPIISFWGPGMGSDSLSVYIDDLDVIAEVSDFYQ